MSPQEYNSNLRKINYYKAHIELHEKLTEELNKAASEKTGLEKTKLLIEANEAENKALTAKETLHYLEQRIARVDELMKEVDDLIDADPKFVEKMSFNLSKYPDAEAKQVEQIYWLPVKDLCFIPTQSLTIDQRIKRFQGVSTVQSFLESRSPKLPTLHKN